MLLRGGRGVGLVASPSLKEFRRARRPFHHLAAQDGPPSPLSRGRMETHCTSGRAMIFMRPQQQRKRTVKTVEAGVIGVGWIGGLRADTLSRTVE